MKPLDTDANAPWKQRFRAPKIWAFPAKGNPRRGIAVSNQTGVHQLYAWDVQTGELHQRTERPTGQASGSISGDGRYIYYLDDAQGNELGHYVRVPFEGGSPEDITPDMAPYASFSFTTSHDGRYVGLTTADQDGFHVYVVPVDDHGAAGERKLIYEATAITIGPVLSHNGTMSVVATNEGAGGINFNLLAFDVQSGAQIGSLVAAENSTVEPSGFSSLPDDPRLLASTNESGVTRPLIWNVLTGERIDFELGDLAGDISPQGWSPDANHILLLQTSEAVHQLYRYNLHDGTLTKLNHPSGTFNGVSFGVDNQILANWQSSTQSPQVIALDATTGALQQAVLTSGEVPPSRGWRSVSFPSSDGQLIQGWLGTPEGEGPFPTILETHGGPTYALTDVYDPGSQTWLDHGFAFLSINYRGSTTFGREFEQKIWSNPGNWEIEDMVAAREWLVREGIAEGDSILLTGWSYGGYLTLLALGKQPHLWAGGMAGIAIADWSVQYEDTADTLKGYQVALFGGTPHEKPEVYAASSPITYADQVRAPVLVIQGSNDTRCPARPMRMYEEKMRSLGKEIEIAWFEAGHGSYVVEQSVEHQELMLRFAYRVLG